MSSDIFYCKQENLGSSISLSADTNLKLTNTIKNGIKWGMYSIQFCLGPMQSYTRSKINKKDIIEAVKLQTKYGINVYSHMPYVYNLCGSAKCLAWNGNKEQDNKTLRMIKSMEYELDILSNFNKGKYRSSCVIHPGSLDKASKDTKILQKGIETIAETINKIKFPEKSMLLLENSAGEGNKIAKNIDELVKIYELVKSKENVGVCIDSCHMFGAGLYNMGKICDVDNFLKEFDSKLGLDKLKLIHLNDSMEKFGSKKDRHELIGRGYIWQDNLDVLRYFLDKTKYIPTVLETSPTDYFVIQSL
jgi:deoxyribonuclease-4